MKVADRAQNDVVLELKNITKRFPGVAALDGVNFRLRKGVVHALMGENGAGKSTLMKILSGIYRPDEGEICLHGKTVVFSTPKHALDSKIAMIHQELSPILDMTIAENVFLGKELLKNKMIDMKKMNAKAAQLLEKVGVKLSPSMQMRELSVSQMQMVEIAKALSYDAEIIIMDEPSATITEREVDSLFRMIEKLKQDGRCIVYISHKMDEVFKIADEITVLRDGRYIGTYNANEIDENRLIVKMVDRELTEIYPERRNQAGEEILRLEGFTQEGVFEDVSFALRRGEILGFAGLMGSGRTQIMNAIFGVTKPTSGVMYIKGQKVERPVPRKLISRGVGYVTEDRKGNGLVLEMSVYDNIILPSLSRLSGRGGWIHRKKAWETAEVYRQRLSVKTPDLNQSVKQLSGGNQQKIVLAKWLLQDPDILILDEPTRGIDVGAKAEVYKLVAKLAEEGKAIIFISSEMPEILGMSDRIVIFYEGKKKGELESEDASQEQIMILASDVEQGGKTNV